MKLPNRERAVIAPEKLVEYLLNTSHKRGGTKARLLQRFGYGVDNWRLLEADIRKHHLGADVDTRAANGLWNALRDSRPVANSNR